MMSEKLKSWLFKQYWRINQARNVISLIFWVLMVVGIWAPLIQRYFKISTLTILAGGSIVTLLLILLIGYIWDKLQLWRYESAQIVKRNISVYEPVPKERDYTIPLSIYSSKALLKLVKDKKLAEQTKKVEEWLKKFKGD